MRMRNEPTFFKMLDDPADQMVKEYVRYRLFVALRPGCNRLTSPK